MARKSKEILLSEEQKADLHVLAQSTDPGIALRARIILESAVESQGKIVAAKLGTAESNVAKWKKCFLDKGIQGIQESKSVGHPTSASKSSDLPEHILSYIEEHSSNWTVSSIAQHFAVSKNDVYRALKKLNITPEQRVRNWTYKTTDILMSGKYVVIGLFLSSDVKIMAIAEMNQPYSMERIHGELITANSALYKYLDSSETALSLADTVVSYTQMTETVRHNQGHSPKEFLNAILTVWNDAHLVSNIHVFFYGSPVLRTCITSDMPVTVNMDELTSLSEWIGQIFVWVSNCPESHEKQNMEVLLDVIGKYNSAYKDRVEPFEWRCLPETEPFDANANTNGSPLIAASFEEINSQPEPNGNRQEMQLQSDIQLCYEDGTVIHRIVKSDEPLYSAEAFDFSSEDSFKKGINALDRIMSDFSRKIDLTAREQYLSEVKKNKNRWGS